MTINKLILSAPFGNYFSFPHATSTLGTFTAKPRGGPAWLRILRVLSTVRYYPGLGAWKNKGGLRNPGITSLSGDKRDNIISITGFNDEEWKFCLREALSHNPAAVELNVSCPNCPGEDKTDYLRIFHHLAEIAHGKDLIVKLPPVDYEILAEKALECGIGSFHCCNTLPVPGGGLSGKPLKVLSLACVRNLRRIGVTRLIGGGGITGFADVMDYFQAGCTNVAVGTVLFNPLNWHKIAKIAKRLANG